MYMHIKRVKCIALLCKKHVILFYELTEFEEIAKTNRKVKFGRFRPGKGGEDDIIKENWSKLLQR